MRISIDWLKDFIKIAKTTEEISDILTMIGLESEKVSNFSHIDGIIVVLRKSDQQNNLVQFHSDIRSDKIELLKNNSNALSMLVTGSNPFFLLDLLFSLNLPINFPKYNLLIFLGKEFKNL